MQKQKLLWLFLLCFSFSVDNHTQDSTANATTPKEQQIQDELTNVALPNLPEEKKTALSKKEDIPSALDVDSDEVIKKEKTTPNEGKPYFTFSGGLAPFQVSIGILKYFIPEWWGQLDLNLTFLPSKPVDDYYTSFSFYNPYVAFRVVTGYSFYSYRKFEMSLIGQIQFAFISSNDIPILPSLGFRFTIDFFYIDVGVSYAFTVGTEEPIFVGWYPAITVGFRF